MADLADPVMPAASLHEPGKIVVIGIGDDGLAGLGACARALLSRAWLVVGGRRHLQMLGDHPAEQWLITRSIESLADRLQDELGRRPVVVLASGDPCFFGIGPLLAARIGRDRIDVHPHPSAVALAFARLGLAWQDATVVSAHGRALDGAIRQARGAGKLAVLTDDDNTPAVVAAALLDAGARDADAWVFEHLGGPRERAISALLAELPDMTFARLNVLIVPELYWHGTDQVLGRGVDDFAHTAGLVTKPEVRAVSISKLRLTPDSVVWDVGAGSGSVAIEASGLTPRGRVFAVERAAEQLGHLRTNVRAHGRQAVVEVVSGAAPSVLASLPSPDAVFVGGGGADVLSIVDAAFERLGPGGRLVANLATLDRLSGCLDWGHRRGLAVEVVQIAISRGVDLRGSTRLQAENPVFVLTVERPA